MQNEVLIADHGPTFIGTRIKASNRVVCVLTPRISVDAAARKAVREMVRDDGGDCGMCHGCEAAQI